MAKKWFLRALFCHFGPVSLLLLWFPSVMKAFCSGKREAQEDGYCQLEEPMCSDDIGFSFPAAEWIDLDSLLSCGATAGNEDNILGDAPAATKKRRGDNNSDVWHGKAARIHDDASAASRLGFVPGVFTQQAAITPMIHTIHHIQHREFAASGTTHTLGEFCPLRH